MSLDWFTKEIASLLTISKDLIVAYNLTAYASKAYTNQYQLGMPMVNVTSTK